MVVAGEVYDDKATVDRGEEELSKALEPFAAVDVQLLNDEDLAAMCLNNECKRATLYFRVLIQNTSLRKYLAEDGVTELLKPGGGRYRLD